MKKLRAFWQGLLVTLLGALGVSSCIPACMYGGPEEFFEGDMYGMPPNWGSVNGQVKDAADSSKKIPGIRISLSVDGVLEDRTFTDDNGDYSLYSDELAGKVLKLDFEDIDGEKNGSYKSASKTVTGIDGENFVNMDLESDKNQ